MTNKTINEVLPLAKKYLDDIENERTPFGSVSIQEVYEDLSIFDWFKEDLTKSDLKDMIRFMNEAIKLGYTGEVSFKVGAAGCANGMWAYHEDDDDCLYKSFTPSYNYWSFCVDGIFYPEGEYFDSIKSIRDLEKQHKLVVGLWKKGE